MIQLLNGIWHMRKDEDKKLTPVNIPGSVYSALIENQMLDNPFFGENEYDAREISNNDYVFEKVFTADRSIITSRKIYLIFNGIDTIASIKLNNHIIGFADNMHRVWEYDVSDFIVDGDNKIQVYFTSPVKYIQQKNAKKKLWGVASTLDGYPHIRKAHYMFGWDWGPQLPDLGIWRDVELIGINFGRIDSIYTKQIHTQNEVDLSFETKVTDISSENLSLEITITFPDGNKTVLNQPISSEKTIINTKISNPMLWNVRGYGEQNLYNIHAILKECETVIDEKVFDIGLRTVEICRNKDEDGEEFCFSVNGTKIFAMGANYIPEDNIISRCSRTKTEELLNYCVQANFNMVRVWGGGYYPDDYFYQICDRLGLLVWQDFMFACSVYNTNIDFCRNIKLELIDNIKRIRNHACLGMWCGNNEIESAWQYWGLPEDPELKNGYIRMFEVLLPKVLSHYDSQTFYWPSSPSSGGGFNDSGAEKKGDSHYWEVWHSLKPFTEYKKHTFSFCSEYGFESIPCMKTVKSFATNNDLNLMSPVMEAHQKCEAGNEKLLYYLAQMMHYPSSFEGLIYMTQLVQADTIKLNVEHMRRNRGRCMGSLYWQVNDSNPVISWSSIDYYHRWKALHYYAKKFYSPVLCSVNDENASDIIINVSNERMTEFNGKIKWRIRNNLAEIVEQGESQVCVNALAAKNCVHIKNNIIFADRKMSRKHYLEYSLIEHGAVLSNSTFMFVQPKQFEFINPNITCNVDEMSSNYKITLHSECYAKGVYLEIADMDCIFSDNWFDMHGSDIHILVKKSAAPINYSCKKLRDNIRVVSYYDMKK